MTEHPTLFALPSAVDSPDTRAALRTPLGELLFQCAIDAESLAVQADSAVRSATAHVFRWDRGEVHVELLVAELPASLPSPLRIDRLVGALWRISARAAVAAVQFDCRGAFGSAPSPSSGQGLETTIWEASGVEVTAGTTDGEGLAAILQVAPMSPRHWRERFIVPAPEAVRLISHLEDGLRADLPGLEPGETAEFHFAFAWGPPSDGTAGWMAVDITPSRILSCVARTG